MIDLENCPEETTLVPGLTTMHTGTNSISRGGKRLPGWKTCTALPRPDDGELFVVKVLVNSVNPRDPACQVLSEKDLERAAKFYFEHDRSLFLGSRIATRLLLQHCTGIPAAEIQLCAGPHGKPALLDSHRHFEFNLSHSNYFCAIALARGFPVGVDIESLDREIDCTALARNFFSSDEFRGWRAAGSLKEDFFNVWTRKEAFTKACGTGVSEGLRSFSVPCGGDIRAAQVICSRGDGYRWGLWSFPPVQGFSGTVCAPVDLVFDVNFLECSLEDLLGLGGAGTPNEREWSARKLAERDGLANGSIYSRSFAVHPV